MTISAPCVGDHQASPPPRQIRPGKPSRPPRRQASRPSSRIASGLWAATLVWLQRIPARLFWFVYSAVKKPYHQSPRGSDEPRPFAAGGKGRLAIFWDQDPLDAPASFDGTLAMTSLDVRSAAGRQCRSKTYAFTAGRCSEERLKASRGALSRGAAVRHAAHEDGARSPRRTFKPSQLGSRTRPPTAKFHSVRRAC